MTPNDRNYAYTTPPAGYRMPEELRLGEARLQIADLPRSIAYYEKVLGLRVIRREDSRAWLGADGSERVILELNERAGAAPVPRRGRLGLYHFAVLLPDRASLARFVRHLAAIGEYAGMSDHLVSEAVYLTDPDGLGIEVYADRARSAWTSAGALLNMGTLPLDVADLVRTGVEKEWTGAPQGTVMGHIHLYINDIDAAERFYHVGMGLDKVNLEFPGALFMSAGGYHHHLGTNTWAASAPVAGEGDARLLEWTIELPSTSDVESLAANLSKNGLATSDDNGQLIVADPWTTGVRVRAAG